MAERPCQYERNLARCPCTYEPCEKKGLCCECLHYHWSRGELPACLFPPEIERTYDRSLKRFIEYYKDKV
ncbi:hypothetical protein DRO48_03585 [Candidatus Bathyarchaeota archaeon]|nr:MAG: hypothetical protein DRO48_03585 [Candidatus Bathyarchaeota archaeon]